MEKTTEPDKYDSDITKLKAAIDPLMENGLHPAAAIYIGVALLVTAAKATGWPVEEVVKHVVSMYYNADGEVPPGATVH